MNKILSIIDGLFSALAEDEAGKALELARRYLAPNVVTHDWLIGDERFDGPEALFQRVLGPSNIAFPDGRYEIKRRFADEESVCLDAVFHATFSRDYLGIPAHGKPVSWAFRDLYVVEAGLITELHFGHDTLAAKRALGWSPDRFPWVVPI